MGQKKRKKKREEKQREIILKLNKERGGEPSKRNKLYIHRKNTIEHKTKKKLRISRETSKSAVTCIF